MVVGVVVLPVVVVALESIYNIYCILIYKLIYIFIMTTSTNTNTATTTAYKTIVDLIGPTLYIKQKQKTKSTTTQKKDATQTPEDTSSSLYTIEACPTPNVFIKQKKHVEYVLLYFSASWCPPCQSFTPILAEFYQTYSATMEIIYISSDRNLEEFTNYYCNKMPFSTLHPYDTNASDTTTTLRLKLPKVFSITGLPTLIVLHISPPGSGGVQFVTDQGRVDLMNHQHPHQFDAVWKKWKSIPKPLLSIEEGVALSKRGDGSLFSILSKLVNTLLQNPIYIFGIYYIIKFYGKSIYQMAMMSMNSNNSTSTANTIDPSLLEPIPEDEF